MTTKTIGNNGFKQTKKAHLELRKNSISEENIL